LTIHDLFPWKAELSEGIDHEAFCSSLLVQPDMYLRVRPGKAAIVKQKLEQAGIAFKEVNDSCLSLTNASKLDGIIELNKDAVVQDLNSQRVGEYFNDVHISTALNVEQKTLRLRSGPLRLWDCCAGSGGKSIMAFDSFDTIELTVSDVRPAILKNLAKRFAEAGIKNYHSFIADLTLDRFDFRISKFELIIADVPCTGSGTWGRTPEQLAFFDPAEIEKYSILQKKITTNIIPFLQPGGQLLYITCSVFKKENEAVVKHIEETTSLRLQKMELLKGYDQKADTLFAALFTA
jgi:16S rRNA (cytosine967-C5)-methyltransferase